MSEKQVQEQSTETQEDTGKPEHISDKFWDADSKSVNVEALSTSYNTLEKKLGKRTEDLTKQIRQDMDNQKSKNVPKEYEIKLPDDLPEDVQIDIDKEQPLMKWWSEKAKEMGFSQDQFNEGISQFVNNEVNSLPNIEQEMLDLGDNAKERVESANLWAKKHLSEDAYNTISNLASTSNGIKTLEEIMSLNKKSVMPSTPTAIEGKPTLEDLRSMMKDPRYWKDGEKDNGYIQRVTKLFEAI
jgi:hypothetical protein|tara:strand:- start:3741 stop:4466 length:726 start_codon:yes stop_codon:yes gene_type:complete